jgi:aminotransferase
VINLFQPRAGDAELAAVAHVFSSNWLGRGERVAEFERGFGAYIRQPADDLHAVSSCTEGLFHALGALGLGAGDEVILPTVSFIGAAHAVRTTGADIALCDVDPATLNPTVEHVERTVSPRTKAILLLHYGGGPGSVAGIAEMATQRSLTLVEDAAVALGSFVADRACGTFGDVGVWSFDSMKVVTTGDGGMVWCRDQAVAERIRRSTQLGVGSSGFDRRLESARWWEVDPAAVGRRGGMNDVAAAIGLAQLKRLPGFLHRREEIAAAYDEGLRGVPWLTLPPQPAAGAARIFYWIRLNREGGRDRLARYLLERGIYTNFQYWPLHRTRMYASSSKFPGADAAADSTLLLPLHQGLQDEDVDRVIATVSAFDP